MGTQDNSWPPPPANSDPPADQIPRNRKVRRLLTAHVAFDILAAVCLTPVLFTPQFYFVYPALGGFLESSGWHDAWLKAILICASVGAVEGLFIFRRYRAVATTWIVMTVIVSFALATLMLWGT